MKKPLKISLITLGVVGVVLVGVAAWIFSQFFRMQADPTAKLTDSLYVIDCGMANVYVLKTGNQAVLFDAGPTTEALARGFSTLGLNPAGVSAVFLTHSDSDHTGGLPLFPKAKVYLSRDEAAYLDGRALRHFLFITRKNVLPVSGYLTLADGDSVTFDGTTVRAIMTPGHTAGSMSYLADDMLFTGDLCLLKDGVVEPMLAVVTEDKARDLESIRAVAGLPGVRYLCTAHTGVSSSADTALAKWR